MVIPEDLQSKFRSKQDLYNLLSIDRELNLVYFYNSVSFVSI